MGTQEPDEGHVISRDGTRIGYLTQGSGPAVVLVQGAMADVHAYQALAEALAESHTVVRAERRGRGISPVPYTADHTIAKDVDDLDAVMAATGADTVFGLSSGAVITLEAARTLPGVKRIAVYEPPFYPDGISRPAIRRLFSDIEHRRYGAALIGALTTAGTAPAPLTWLPRPLARMLGRLVLTIQARRAGRASTLRDLLPGVRFDFHDVAEIDGHLDSFRHITQPTLLLSGTASPHFLQTAIRSLHQLLPDATHVEFPGLGHDGPWNSGDPRTVAAAITEFLDDRVPRDVIASPTDEL